MVEDYDVRYLLIEGLVRANPYSGLLEWSRSLEDGKPLRWYEVRLGRQRFMWESWDHYISSLEWAPIKVRRTVSEFDTARAVASLYRYYSKPWESHKSLRGLYHEQYTVQPLEASANPVRAVAKEFPGVGVERSLTCQMRWQTVFDMVTAETADWEQLIGPGTARKIMNWIHGTKE
jgi:hypothetical protein